MGDIVWGACTAHTAAMMREPPGGADAARASRVFAAFDALKASLAAARADLLVIIATDHFETFSHASLPVFALGQGASFDSWGEYGSPQATYRGDEAAGETVLAQMIEDGFDLVSAANMRLDHAFSCPLGYLMADPQLPVLPVYVNCTVAPLPTLRRCHAFGQSLGKALRRQTSAQRVAVLGTGGLSHWVGTPQSGLINQAFDGQFLQDFENGDYLGLAGWDEARVVHEAGNGAAEVRNWLAAAGAVGARGANRLAYEPVQAWRTGIGLVQLELP